MTDAEIDAVWERLWTATYPVFETRREPAFTTRLMAAVKAELAAVLREREPSPESLAAAERCRSLADPGWVDWPNMPDAAFADLRLVLAEFLRLAPPPAPG